MNTHEFKILLIDDDEDDFVNLRDLFQEISRSKYSVTWKSSYDEGIRALREQAYDACLLDYRLGEKTGLDLLREVHETSLKCPIIFLTGHGDFELDLQAMQVGAADYLVKGQISALLLERSVRYSMKRALDMEELKESKAQIVQQDRLASLGLLASSLAHEIGTPLGIIRSRAEIMEKKSAGNEALKDSMGVIISQIDRMAKLVNSLLHLAREKKSDLAAPVSVNQVIQDVLNLLQHEFDRKGINFITQLDGEFIVKAESGPLGQVLLNLLINAVHAIEEARNQGRAEAHEISLLVGEKSGRLNITIKDTGNGISEANLSQIFKPFFTTKEIGQGTGLGLATSYRLVQSWGGSISVESQAGKFSTFTVSLPKAL